MCYLGLLPPSAKNPTLGRSRPWTRGAEAKPGFAEDPPFGFVAIGPYQGACGSPVPIGPSDLGPGVAATTIRALTLV